MSKRIVLYSHDIVPTGHGGNRRSAQLLDILKRVGPVEISPRASGGKVARNASAIALGLWDNVRRRRWELHPKAIRSLGHSASAARLLRTDAETLVALEVNMRGNEALIEHVHRMDGRVAVFPANIDSLSPDRVDPMSSRRSPSWVFDEIEAIRRADLVCCISREEQWLLSLFGVQALFLPYFPPASVQASLSPIRVARTTSTKDKVLVVGTATNRPTLLGMTALLQRAAELVVSARGRQVIVAGYGTEVLRAADVPKSIEILGSVSPQQMDRLFTEAVVCICFQLGTTGALTRIADLLCAGVPVLANALAARTYHNVSGVRIAEDSDHLLHILRSETWEPFDAPSPPVDLEMRLVRALREL